MDKIEDFQGSKISSSTKKAALQAMERLKVYYSKTDAEAFTVSTIIDPRLKLFYHEEKKWERKYIDEAKSQFQRVFKNYSHQATSNNNEETGEIEDEFISQIYMQHNPVLNEDELEHYLMATRALGKTNVLQWWKVIKIYLVFNLKFYF